MKLLIFLHGTVVMHKNAIEKTREERVQQVIDEDESIFRFEDYVPTEGAIEKLTKWNEQGCKIYYLSSNTDEENLNKDSQVLKKYEFPEGELLYRVEGKTYKNIAERIMPDIIIEDDCESIGGEIEMVYPNLEDGVKKQIKSIVVKEFEGIKHLDANIDIWMNRIFK